MKNELKIVTFTGAELYSLLPNTVQAMYQFNVIEQHNEEFFEHILKKQDWPNMQTFLRGGFLFSAAFPNFDFWVNYTNCYNQEFEEAAIAEII